MLNEMNPNIKFTKDTSEEELPFLDVLVKKRNTRTTTDIYYKVMDTPKVKKRNTRTTTDIYYKVMDTPKGTYYSCYVCQVMVKL